MTRYQMIYQYLDANAITNIVDAYIKGRRDLYKEYKDLIIGLTKEEERRIRQDTIEEIENIFDYDYFLKYSNDDRLISFNNLSLMIRDMLEQLKEKK